MSEDQQHLENRFALERAQLEAIDEWNRARRLSERAADAVTMTREMRLDVSRRIEARRREHAAIIARAHEQLELSGQQIRRIRPARVVIAHRNEWLTDKVATRLRERGVDVVGAFCDGADAAGAIVAEQPELVLVEDLLPTLPGRELVRRVRAFSPASVVAAQVADSGGVDALVDAGAHAVFTRKIPPVDVADELLVVLDQRPRSRGSTIRL